MPDIPAPPALDFLSSLKKPLQWALAAGLLGALVAIPLPNYYQSVSRLLPAESKGIGANLGGLASAAAAFGVNVPGADGSDANFVDVLNSRWLKEQLLKAEFQYHDRSWRFGAEREVKGTLYDYLEARNMDRAVQAMGSVLAASRDVKSKVISISAETSSPELSQLIVQRAVKLLEGFQQDKGRTRGGAKAIFAEARLVDARRKMEEAGDALGRFLQRNRNFQTSTDPAVRLEGSRLETELRLRQQLVISIAMSVEQALMEEKNDIPIVNVLDPANLPMEKSKPKRSMIVLLAMVVAGSGSWLWLNREWLRAQLAADDEPGSPVQG